MFKLDRAKSKKINTMWWVVLGVAGLALVLFLQQLPSGPIAGDNATAQPAAPADQKTAPSPDTPAEDTATGEQQFLADYDPDAATLLTTTAEEEDSRSGWEIALDFGVKLIIIIGLVYLALYGLRWLQRTRYKNISGGATINVLETTGLSPGRSLHLVVVGEKTLLLGATDHEISVLAELADAHVSLPDEETTFAETLTQQQSQPVAAPTPEMTPETPLPQDIQSQLSGSRPKEPEIVPIFPIPSLNVEEAVEYHSEWQSTMRHLRAGIRRIQETVES